MYRNSPCVVLGKYQNAYQEVNYPYCVKNNIPIVRRESGGGAVYHDLGNINFCRISSNNSIAIEYDFLDKLVSALNDMSINAVRKNDIDIYLNDKKISGNAQRKAKSISMHHGTLLYNADLQSVKNITNKSKGIYSTRAISSRKAEVTNIVEHLENPMNIDDFMNAMVKHFCDSVQPLPKEIIEKAKALEPKYNSFEWSFAKSPAFTYSCEYENIKLSYSVKKGIIQEISLDCDFLDSQFITNALTGATLDFYEISRIINSVDKMQYSQAKMLIDCIF